MWFEFDGIADVGRTKRVQYIASSRRPKEVCKRSRISLEVETDSREKGMLRAGNECTQDPEYIQELRKVEGRVCGFAANSGTRATTERNANQKSSSNHWK